MKMLKGILWVLKKIAGGIWHFLDDEGSDGLPTAPQGLFMVIVFFASMMVLGILSENEPKSIQQSQVHETEYHKPPVEQR